MNRQAIVAFFLSLLLAIAAQARAGEVERWNRVMTDAAAAAETDPLTESRAFSIVHAAVHNALNAVRRHYESYGDAVAAAPGASPEAAVAGAAHAALIELMPERRPAFDRALADVMEGLSDRRAAFAGLEVGRKAAAAVLEQRRNDGASRAAARMPGKRAGEYRPTPPDFTPAFGTQWGQVRPFVLQAASQFRPAPPFPVKSVRARAEVEEVHAVGGQGSALRTAEQTEIARYWYENSTQGWNRVTREVAAARNLDAWQSARLFALVNFAMADGYIGGFEAKYHYNYWRPATAIRESGDAKWLSELGTPPLPDHPSGHTILGAAVATVLARYFGTDFVAFSMTSGAPYPGITRRFWSFSEAARENGASRVLAGIHFPFAVQAGYEQGERTGAWTYEHALRPVAAN